MKKLALFAVLFVFLGGMISFAGATTLDEIVKRGELRIAVQTQGPPFSFIDKNGQRTGSSIEFCELMAQEMGVKLKILDFDWDGLIPALLTKKADILAADMTPKLKRALKVSFTKPFFTTGHVLYVKADSPYTSIEELNKPEITVAGLLGSAYTDTIKRVLPKAKLKEYKGGGNVAMTAVLNGRADCSVVDETSYHAMSVNYPQDSFKVFPQKLSYSPLAFAVRPEDRHLLEWINLFFTWIENDGRYDRNIQYWIMSKDWQKDH